VDALTPGIPGEAAGPAPGAPGPAARAAGIAARDSYGRLRDDWKSARVQRDIPLDPGQSEPARLIRPAILIRPVQRRHFRLKHCQPA
jgi:hypothetical protein